MRVIVGVALTLASSGCFTTPPGDWHEGEQYRWRALAVPRRGNPGFSQLPVTRTGLDFTNSVSEQRRLQHPNSLLGSGVALGDADGDGLIDIYLSRLEGPNALFRNQGNWRFENIADQAGVAAGDRLSTGAVFADVDGDRDLDLLVSSLGGPNTLFINGGSATFVDRTELLGVASDRGSTTMALADVDADGDLDLYIANYKAVNALDLFAPGERTFDQVVQQVGEQFEVVPKFRDHYRVRVMEDLGIVVRIQRAEPDWFYLNDGSGRFEHVPFTSGRFLDEDGRPLTTEPDYFGLTARFYDVDSDGDPDLYVCNDFEDPDQFWLNDGTGVFRAVPRLALRTTSNAGMAVDFADLDRDGDVDFFEVDMLSLDRIQRQRQKPSHTALPKLVGQMADRPQMQRNTLFVNRGDGTFAQVAELAGVEASNWTWGTLFLDVDLDGYEDILATTGHVWDVQNADADARVVRTISSIDWRKRILLYPDLHQKNVAFRNNGDLSFDEFGERWGFADTPDVSHGLAAGDLDGDGDLDIVVNRLGFPVGVYRNETNAKRIAVRLQGTPPNTHGVGAIIHVLGGPVAEQQREVTVGGLYLSSSDQGYAFATGDAVELTIVVDWRSGRRTEVAGARPNRLYEIREPSEGASGDPEVPHSADSFGSPLFADVSAELGHRHAEAPFDDFLRQPLLPNELSRLGPGVTWYDVDSDGDEDLLISSGGGGTLTLYRNDAGRLRRVPLELAETALDQTTVLALPNPSGGAELLVGQMSYEAETPAAALRQPAVIRIGLSGTSAEVDSLSVAVPGELTSTGPLALADYDGDGDLDLFVGGRVLPAKYPAAATSQLLRNTRGAFEVDKTNTRPLQEVGLVSGAVFSDLDGDGDPDLLLATEWGPLRMLRNDNGRFADATEAWGLAPYMSRWNGITTGDLNGDGRPDVVATSWGRNTKHRADRDRPLYLYHADFDRNGTTDVLTAQYDDELRGVVPLDAFPRLALAMPFIRLGTRSFAAYADATLREIIGPGLDAARRLEVNTLDHAVFINRGTAFDPVSLPIEAQFAPAFYAGVADFDGDGHEDLFLSQNFFPTELETPRYDAGRGLLLRGDGSGALSPVPGQVSGLRIYGDQRGAAFADYNVDGRVDLVVSQNGSETKLYRNQGARPGLRVRLIGGPANPHAIGAVIRLVYRDRQGPAREIHGGSGYWSHNGAVQVMGLDGAPAAVWVRWPGGSVSETAISGQPGEITIRMEREATGAR